MAYNPNMYMPQGYQTWQQPINGLVSVTGMEAARAYQLPPNSSMPLFDANEDVLYVKTTDGAGFPTVRAFRFEEIESVQKPSGDWVPRSEFDALADKVRRLENGEQPVSGE